MISTGRGTERAENDRYFTPLPLARALCKQLTIDGWLHQDASLDLLEPSAGDGAFVQAMRETFRNASITANDIVDDSERWYARGASAARTDDLLTILPGQVPWHSTIGNCPYIEAEEHVRHSFDLVSAAGGIVAYLLPLGFLESQGRRTFWSKHKAACVYVLSERPSFTGTGTDSTAYGFFVWKRGRHLYPTRLEVISWR